MVRKQLKMSELMAFDNDRVQVSSSALLVLLQLEIQSFSLEEHVVNECHVSWIGPNTVKRKVPKRLRSLISDS